MLFRCLLTAALVLTPVAARAMTFEAYYPQRANKTLVFEYSSAGEGTTKQLFKGTLTRSPAGPETRGGIAYQTVEHVTSGLPEFFPKRWKTYHRATDNGLYSGQLNDSGEVEAYLEFPVSAEPGKPWPVESAFWDTESFSLVPRVETPAGTFENCIRVERSREDPASGQTLTNNTTYCSGVSAVHSMVEHRAQDFRSVTEMRLVEIRD